MSKNKFWIEAKDLIIPQKINQILSSMIEDDAKTVALRAPKSSPPQDDKTAQLPIGAPAPQPPAPLAAVKWAPVPKMGEIQSSEPSLASRARPDLATAADRSNSFSSSYHDPKAFSKSLRNFKGSSNIVFHGEMANGDKYVAKPHEGIAHQHRFDPGPGNSPLDDESHRILKSEAPDSAKRHDATYSIMAAMGAHHMVTPGMQTNMHARHQFGGPDADENDSPAKRLTMASANAGGVAHVQQFVKDAQTVNGSSKEELDKVDAEHRLHGMVAHLLFGNGDGHSGNVMLHKSGHPVLIDHDITLSSAQARGYKDYFGKESIRSVFAPKGPLDYQSKLDKDSQGNMIPVGTNFPPRMKETLQRIADGYYSASGDGNLGLSRDDHSELKKNAMSLLQHGVEGTLDRRHDIDAEARAKKAAKAARNETI
jgi:hypothetical protein